MKAIIFLLALAVPAFAAPAKPTPSGPLKAYKGPEGEIVIMVAANDGKQMLVHFRNLGGDLEAKTLLYDVDDQGGGNMEVYITKKRGSKTYRSIMLTERDRSWSFFHPTDFKIHFDITYSEALSDKYKVDDVVNAYKP